MDNESNVKIDNEINWNFKITLHHSNFHILKFIICQPLDYRLFKGHPFPKIKSCLPQHLHLKNYTST